MQQLSYSGVNSASMCRRCVPPTARTALEARIVSVCASYAQFSLLAIKRDGRKGSANPSRPMESRRLTPPRLDRNRNAHPSCRDRRCVLVRKNAVSASQKQRGPSCGATRRKRPLCLVPPTCNSSASRRGALAPRLPPTFSGSRPMADFRHTALAASVHPCAHSAVRVGFFRPVSFRLAPGRFPAFAVPAAQHPRT